MSDIEGKAARVAASECGQRVSFNDEGMSRMPNNARWSALTVRADAAQRRGYRFLSSWFESLAVASHPLQPDSFILRSAADTAAATA